MMECLGIILLVIACNFVSGFFLSCGMNNKRCDEWETEMIKEIKQEE